MTSKWTSQQNDTSRRSFFSRFTFQVAFWDALKTLDDGAARRAGSLARLMAHLVVRKQLSLTVLKVLHTLLEPSRPSSPFALRETPGVWFALQALCRFPRHSRLASSIWLVLIPPALVGVKSPIKVETLTVMPMAPLNKQRVSVSRFFVLILRSRRWRSMTYRQAGSSSCESFFTKSSRRAMTLPSWRYDTDRSSFYFLLWHVFWVVGVGVACLPRVKTRGVPAFFTNSSLRLKIEILRTTAAMPLHA